MTVSLFKDKIGAGAEPLKEGVEGSIKSKY
jgi:hypothetical protein